jgi:hypothetical protein
MTIYNLSAEERKQRASQIRDLKKSRYLYKQYLEQKEQAEREQREQEIAAYHAQKEKDSQNFLVKTFHTIGDVASNVITGAAKGLEGIYDLGAGVVGAVGGIFDSDFRDSVQQHIAYDWTSENIGNPLQELTKHSYLNDWGKFGETIENVASGVGQMLPSLAMNVVVPGSGIAVTGLSAAGKGTEQAFKEEGTNYYRGLLYGAASGGVEMLTEKISGVVGSNATGKGFLDKTLSKLTKNKLGKVVVGSLGEAGEEALSEFVNPLMQNIYKDKGFFEDFMTTEHLKDIGESALVGGLTSMVYGETVGRLTRRAANIQESLSELSTLEKKENNLWSNGKLAEQQEKINQQKQEIYESISKELQSVKTDEGRAKYIDMLNKYGVNKFNADGTIIAENGSNLSLDANGEQITDGTTNQAQNGLATAQNYNQDAYSPTLRGKEQSLEFAPTSEELTETQRLAKQEFTRLNKGKVKANLVFSNSMGKDADGNDIQGAYRNGVLYISTNANAVQEVIKHEMTHYAEGTKAYVRYARYILKEIQNNKTLSERFGNLVEKIKQTKDLYQKVEQNKSLSQQEYDIITEVVAQYTSENLFTSEEQIARLARSNRTFFEKFKNWIADKIAYFKKRKNLSKDERQVLDFLTKAEKLYSKALSESWGAMDYAESIDNSDENRYSIKDKLINKTFPPYNESYSEANQIATRWAKQDNVKDGWQKLVSYKDKWYKIEKFSDMDFGYLIVDRIPNSKYNAELEELRKYEQNNYADSLDQGLSEYENVRRNKSVDSTISNDRHSDRNIPTMAKSGDSGRENTINGRRDSGQGNRNKQGNVRYSLSKDSQGNALSENQEKFFKDSKVRDELGNLLVVYHGTKEAGFNEFVYDKNKQTGTDFGKAFYFTSDITKAKGYSYDITKDSRIKEYQEEKAKLRDKYLKTRLEEDKQAYFSYTWNGKTLEDLIDDESYTTEGGEIKNVYLNLINPLIVNANGDYFFNKYESYFTRAKNNNNDGIIVKNVIDNPRGKEKAIDVYIAFESNQIKNTTNLNPTKSSDIRYSLKNSVEEDVLKTFGKTYDWKETGYILKDGTKLDLSGKHEGAAGGSRSVDHREIFDIYEDSDVYGTEAMVEFMGRGNIRVSPEYPGVNIQVEPTQEQYEQIQSMVERLGWKEKAFIVDIDNKNGDTIETLEYEGAVSGRKIVADIQYYFKNGKAPHKSELSQFRYSLSKGQVKKIVANKTRHKSYSRKDAEIVVNNILDNYMDFGGKYGDIAGKTKQQVIDQLWLYMNTSTPGYSKAAFDIADYIIENGFVEDIVGSEINEEHVYIVETLREYMHKIDLDSIKGEIKYRYDKDNSPYLIWGKRKGERGMGADQIAQELQERGIRIEAINEADCFFEIADTYKNSLNQIKKSAKQSMKELGSDTIKQLRQDIVREILVGIDTQGQETEFNKTIQKYVDKVSLLKAQLKDTKERNKAINNLFSSLDRVKAFEKYQSAEIQLADEVVGLVKLLKNVKTYRDNLSSNIRDIMSKYSKEVNGTKLYNLIANNGDGIDNPVGAMIEDIARNRGELTTAEIKNLDMIIRNFIHNVKEYDRVFFEGKTQSDTEIVTQAIKETREAVKVKDSGLGGSFSQLTRWLQSPVWRFERLGSYRKNSIMARVFKEFQQGVDKQADFNMRVAEHYKEFFKTNKKIVNEWSNQKIEIAGTQMSKGQMISLYMLSHRKQAQSHLFDEFGNGTIRLTDEKSASAGKVKDAINKGQDVQINRAVISEIESHLTDVDKDFIKLTKEFFNKIARDAKYDTDMAMFGVSNVDDSNDYIPIRVADDQLYKELGNDKFNFTNLFSVYNASFNQDTKPNANNKIVVENIIDIVNRHSKQMSAYYGLAQPVKTFNRLFNKKLEDGSKLRVEINKVDSSFESYVGKLLSDMQGNVKSKEGFDRLVGKVRGWGARAALGFNPKVLASQFVSLPAAAAVGVKYRNLAKGLAMAVSKKTDFENLTKYAPMLYDRFRDGNNIDVGLLKQGQGVAKSIDKFTDIVTAPIGMIDKFVCGAVWNACLEQTKDNKNYANYSEEHYKAAAQLTEEAVIKTQANYTALYRPEILRSQSSFLQLTTMFMSEPLQQFSLLASAVDKIRIARTMLKNAKTDAEKAEAESLFKQAKSESAHAISAVVVDTIILALIAQAFKWIKGKEDENKVQGFLMDFAENYIGMFPIVKDLYSYFSGYDITNMAYTGLTNIATALEEMYNLVDLLASGESYSDAEINGKIRKVVLGISQLFGVPVRNVETYIKGIIQKFSPDAVYRYDNFFYNKSASNYNADLKAAIEKGDESLADTILDLMLEEEKVSVKDKEIRKNLISLYNAGYSVLPKSVGDYITYDGEKIYFTQKQKNRFKSIYEQSNEKVKVLITSNEYKEVEPKIQAQSIKFIYDYYYNLALEDLLGVDLELKNLLFGYAFDIEDLALYVSYARSLESDKDENGKTINGTLKAKIQAYVNSLKLTIAQKYMLMGYLGYTNKVGKAQVKAYIQRLKLTKEQKAKLFEMSGYSDEK